MKKSIVVCVLVFLCYYAKGQAVVYSSGGVIYLNKNNTKSVSLEGKRGSFFGGHYLGSDIADKYSKFMSYYVSYEQTEGAYATEKMIVHKQPIYNAVKDIDKHLKKSVKKGNIRIEDAKSRFDFILDKAIEIRFYNTTQVEALLRSTKSPEEMEEILRNIRIN